MAAGRRVPGAGGRGPHLVPQQLPRAAVRQRAVAVLGPAADRRRGGEPGRGGHPSRARDAARLLAGRLPGARARGAQRAAVRRRRRLHRRAHRPARHPARLPGEPRGHARLRRLRRSRPPRALGAGGGDRGRAAPPERRGDGAALPGHAAHGERGGDRRRPRPARRSRQPRDRAVGEDARRPGGVGGRPRPVTPAAGPR